MKVAIGSSLVFALSHYRNSGKFIKTLKNERRKVLKIYTWQSHAGMEILRFPLRLDWWRRGLALCCHDNLCPCLITAMTQRLWPTAQHRPPSSVLFISPRPSHSAKPNLIYHVDKTSGARASSGALGLVGGGGDSLPLRWIT